MVNLVYFAWVRERMGMAEEMVELPPSVLTIADLALWLAGRDEAAALAFANPDVVRAAIDKHHVSPQTPLKGAREIAFFPPMTGG